MPKDSPASKAEPPAYIARCPACGGANWGPIAPVVRETLRNGEVVECEQWGCLTCYANLEENHA